ncbi:hypothetical protein PFISCL1PPCAC_10788, partial [Pristionchus fissidentatus]
LLRLMIVFETHEISDHSEDGECSNSPKRQEIVEVLDSGAFVLDRTDDAIEEEGIVVDTSSQETKEEDDRDDEDNDVNKSSKKSFRDSWLKSTMASVMTLNDETSKPAEAKKKDNRRKQQCFNCMGDHNMTSCPEPKDFRRIRQNRDAFNDAKSKDARYTESSSNDSGEFKPGRLSDRLQRALGIGPNDIPEWVYRMRKMGFVKGYPPGYLKRAVVQQTNPDDLLTFHSDNPELRDDKEEGEAEERPSSPTVNATKVIYYFGFNQTYRALKDREREFRVPPFDEFVSFLEDGVKKNFWEEKKRAERKRKTGPLKGNGEEKKAKIEDDDCMILEAPPPPPVIDLSEMVEKKEEKEESLDESSVGTSSVPSTPGTPASRRVSLGTPVIQRKNLGDGMKKVPSLDAFSKGIVPFQVDEPTPRTGFLAKMLKKIKDTLG